MAKIPNSKAAPKRRAKQTAAIADEFYRKGLGPGYPEEEFGPGDKARTAPGEPASIRNYRGDRYSRFDKPARNGNGSKRQS